VKSAQDAIAYLLDCQLATVATFALKKSRPKSEYARQVSIAQMALDWSVKFGSDLSKTRGADVILSGGNVEKWAEQYFPKVGRSDNEKAN